MSGSRPMLSPKVNPTRPVEHAVHTWSCPPPPVDPVRILRVHKYTDPEKVRPVIRKAAAAAAEAAAGLAQPQGKFVSDGIISIRGSRLTLSSGIEFTCPVFEEHLAGCTGFLGFVLTLGPALDNTVISLIHDRFEPLDALFLETAGWLTIEAASKHLAQHLKAHYGAQGWQLSLRMGPGYDYRAPDGEGRVQWDLRQQRELFALFAGEALPVELMESCAMKPKMSRSGVFGMRAAHMG